MKIHAVIDTNVLISALISKKTDSATVLLLEKLFDGVLTPVYNHEILKEYMEEHFPTTPIVVTPAEMLRIIESEQQS